MTKLIRVWVPTDQAKWGHPRTIARGGQPPQPGRVFDVEVPPNTRTRDAITLVATALQPEPDMKKDARAWAEWMNAQDDVREIPPGQVKPTRVKKKAEAK